MDSAKRTKEERQVPLPTTAHVENRRNRSNSMISGGAVLPCCDGTVHSVLHKCGTVDSQHVPWYKYNAMSHGWSDQGAGRLGACALETSLIMAGARCVKENQCLRAAKSSP